MNIQPYQLLLLSVYLIFIWSFWKIKNTKVRILLVILAAVMFFVNPVRFKQEGGAKLERSISRFDDIPNRVSVDKQSFEDRQDKEMNKLKMESGGLKDEIHD